MKIYKQTIILLLVLVCGLSYASFAPMSLTQAKDQVAEYYESGQYESEQAEITQKAKDILYRSVWLNHQLKNPKKLAIILDIDDTAINNYDVLKKYGFADNDATWDIVQRSTKAIANKPVYELYHEARALGVSVLFITARLDSKYHDSTKQALKSAGYIDYQGLNLITKEYEKLSFADFKIAVRTKITKDGYHIVLNVGDQYSDLTGGVSDYQFKLPNYIYGSY